MREITSAVVTVTLDFSDLGAFPPGSIYEQAKDAAILKLTCLFAADGGSVKIAGGVQVKAISCQKVKS